MGNCLNKNFSTNKNSDDTSATPAKRIPKEEDLHRFSGRIFNNDGRVPGASIFTQQGRKGVNQDAMLLWNGFGAHGEGVLCGVFDGHGPQGHFVARRVRDSLPLKILSALPKGKPELEIPVSEWRKAFFKAYKSMDKDLKSVPSLDCFCSGSTAVTVLKMGMNLYMGNIGDSRAILGTKDENTGEIKAVQLTVDLKPDLPREAERIKKCKGRVFALQDEPEVPRVWLPFDDAPGLAMARAFGDFCLKDYGVISVPEFFHFSLTPNDQFVILASDGVWDVLNNEEVVEIISSSPTRYNAARMLIDAADREWKSKYPTSKMDDCAVVCLFLDGNPSLEEDPAEIPESHSPQESSRSGNENDESEEPQLTRNYTVRSGESNGQGWLGLDGVTRVNSLVKLPRFDGDRAIA